MCLRMTSVLSLMIFVCAISVGCAGGGDEVTTDAVTATDSNTDTRADTRTVPDTTTTPDTTTDPDNSSTQDLPDRELAGECEPFSAVCSEDGRTIQRCSGSGELFDPTHCDVDQVCDELERGPECVVCRPGIDCAGEELDCEPDRPFCLDFETAAQCTSEGDVGNVSLCSPGRCFGGGCMTSGNSTGEACDSNDACHGRRCICGTDDTANLDSDLCGGNMAAGFCTSDECELNGCDPETEVCADFSLPEVFGGEAICVLKDDCSERLGDCRAGHRGDNFICRSLPFTTATADSRTWSLGCWVPDSGSPDTVCRDDDCLAPIGAACSSNSDCIGGLCLLEGDMSYCAAVCNEALGCPDYAACVQLPGSTSTYCLARATEDDCPRLSSNFDIVASPLPDVTGTESIQVCFFRD